MPHYRVTWEFEIPEMTGLRYALLKARIESATHDIEHSTTDMENKYLSIIKIPAPVKTITGGEL